MVLIGGLQKTTLIDFPGKVACTVFTVGCDFRCPFCHNAELVTEVNFRHSGAEPISEEDFFRFLSGRRKVLDGVCITGGEPLLQSDLADFLRRIKKMGLAVKLDTNGSLPEALAKIIKKKLVDYLAMDVKADFDNYSRAAGVSGLTEAVKRSLRLLTRGGIEFELRTTIAPSLHDISSLCCLAGELKEIFGDKNFTWFIQPFLTSENCLGPRFRRLPAFPSAKIEKIMLSLKEIIPFVSLRG